MKLSIVIPCYNEEEILPLTLERLNKLSNEWISRDDLTEIEFVFVDDGSQDRTYDLLTEISKADLRVKVVRFSRNFGHQAALLAGDELVQGDVIVSLDTDLLYLPELFEKVEHLQAMKHSMKLMLQEFVTTILHLGMGMA